MSGSNGTAAVPVGMKSTGVKLTCGGTAFVKRLKRSELNDLMAAAGFNGEVHQGGLLSELTVRAAVVAVEGLVDDDGEPVSLARAKHPTLGMIATRALWDAVTTADVVAIIGVASAKLTEEQQGNSQPPPGGSTPGGGN